MDAYQADKEWFGGRFGPKKKPAGKAGSDLAPKAKEESPEERGKREHDEVMRAQPGAEREAVMKRQADEQEKRNKGN
jgi:hypothetical protein